MAAIPARADGPARIQRIEQHIESARFDEAEAEVRSALSSGELERRELARLHLLAGVIASARRDSAGAIASFRRALSLDPDAILPGSAGPHVATAFEQAKRELGEGRGLDVSATGSQAAPGAAARVSVKLTRDPEKLARRLRIEAGSFRDERPLPPLEHRIEVPAPSEGCSDVHAHVLDRAGNRVWSTPAVARVCVGSAEVAPEVEPSVEAPDSVERPIAAPVWIGVALTGVGVAATSVLGVIALDRRSDYHAANSDPAESEADRQALFDDASSAQRRATIAAIATGVIGAATVTLYLLRPSRSGPELGVRVGDGGTGAVLGGRF